MNIITKKQIEKLFNTNPVNFAKAYNALCLEADDIEPGAYEFAMDILRAEENKPLTRDKLVELQGEYPAHFLATASAIAYSGAGCLTPEAIDYFETELGIEINEIDSIY